MADNPDHPQSPAAADQPPPTLASPPENPHATRAGPEPTLVEADADEVRSFGDYELLGELGRGGMGVVYRARERRTGHMLALKMMLHELAPGPVELRRFRLEARATGQINHPGIVAIHAWGEHDGHLFYTMDYVPGAPLSRLMEKRRFSSEQAVRYLVGMARAAAAAHAQGIVHRDLKPSNVIIDGHDQPCILDFGLAKRQRLQPGEPATSGESIVDAVPADGETLSPTVATPVPARVESGGPVSRATERGAILGTPSYMAPEQARGEHDKVSPATDVHALGCIFYEMLVGRPPFQGGSVADTLKLVREHQPEAMWIEGKRVPAVLEEICRRCLRKEPKDRYPDAAALADDLERRWGRSAQGPRYAGLALAAGAIGLLLAGARWVLAGTHYTPQALLEMLLSPGGPIPEQAGQLLATLLDATLFIAAPLLALLVALAALAAWVWHAERAWLIGVVGVATGLGAGWLLLTGEGAGTSGLAFVLAAIVVVIAGSGIGRLVVRPEHAASEAASVRTEPFLHRLFAAGGQTRAKTSVRSTAPTPVGLADIEPGKVVQQWDGGLVRRGRQKSLDRAVLVWTDTTPAAEGAPLAGVFVRHPAVLGLHAVGSGPEGRFLVTELVAATPLVEMVEREALPPREAVHLAAQLARAVQALHEQGACFRALRPEWIMLRGDLEPMLCPACVPSTSADDRAADCAALGRLLAQWLPPRPSRWKGKRFAVVHEVCDAAAQGKYSEAADLADDLARAFAEVAIRRRDSAVAAVVVLLGVLPWLALGAAAALDPGVIRYVLLGLAPCAVLLGYSQARILVHRCRFRRSARSALRAGDLGRGVLKLALLVGPAALLYGRHGLAAAALLLGYWLAGLAIAALVTAAAWVYAAGKRWRGAHW